MSEVDIVMWSNIGGVFVGFIIGWVIFYFFYNK
jgi:hypothetical protein